jgi:hypothetical protein
MNLPPRQTSDDTLTVTAISLLAAIFASAMAPVLTVSASLHYTSSSTSEFYRHSVDSSDIIPRELAVPPALRLPNPTLPAQLKVVPNLVS